LPGDLVDEGQAPRFDLVLKTSSARWQAENAAAFEAYNDFVARVGLWNDDERDW
jgi:post-segregation antitoxin (ccd killing protein)